MTKLTSLSLFVFFTSAMGLTLSAGCGGDSGDRNPGSSGSGSGASGGSGGSTGGTGSTTGGTTGTSGGSTGTTGGSGGSTGGTGGGVEPGCSALPATTALITDFTYEETGAGGEGGGSSAMPADPEGISFGYDADPPTVASGYSFRYPDSLVSDVTGGAWHVSGSVAAYSGLVINFVCAADASEFSGVSFKISGNAGESGSLKFVVAHGANSWLDPEAAEPSASRCMSENQYSGMCAESFATVEVTEAEQTVTLTWADLKGGKPEASPNPKEIMALRWIFDWDETKNGSPETNAYDVDITIDDVTFTP
jgi:hypothetical protein